MNKMLFTVLVGSSIALSSLMAGNLSLKNVTCYDEDEHPKFKIIKLNGFGVTFRELKDDYNIKIKGKDYHYADSASFSRETIGATMVFEITEDHMMSYSDIDGSHKGPFLCDY